MCNWTSALLAAMYLEHDQGEPRSAPPHLSSPAPHTVPPRACEPLFFSVSSSHYIPSPLLLLLLFLRVPYFSVRCTAAPVPAPLPTGPNAIQMLLMQGAAARNQMVSPRSGPMAANSTVLGRVLRIGEGEKKREGRGARVEEGGGVRSRRLGGGCSCGRKEGGRRRRLWVGFCYRRTAARLDALCLVHCWVCSSCVGILRQQFTLCVEFF